MGVGAHALLGVRRAEWDACDHWHRWPDDLQLLAGLGFGSYRFSLEWSRIEPGEGELSRVALDRYLAMCGGSVPGRPGTSATRWPVPAR